MVMKPEFMLIFIERPVFCQAKKPSYEYYSFILLIMTYLKSSLTRSLTLWYFSHVPLTYATPSVSPAISWLVKRYERQYLEKSKEACDLRKPSESPTKDFALRG